MKKVIVLDNELSLQNYLKSMHTAVDYILKKHDRIYSQSRCVFNEWQLPVQLTDKLWCFSSDKRIFWNNSFIFKYRDSVILGLYLSYADKTPYIIGWNPENTYDFTHSDKDKEKNVIFKYWSNKFDFNTDFDIDILYPVIRKCLDTLYETVKMQNNVHEEMQKKIEIEKKQKETKRNNDIFHFAKFYRPKLKKI